MKNVKISVSGSVQAYYLTLFNQEGYQFKGKKNEDISKSLKPGPYTLKYNVIGNPGTEFTVKFSGVIEPTENLKRVIPNKGYTSRTKEVKV